MTQDAIIKATLDADQARQETGFNQSLHRVETSLRGEMHAMERRIYLSQILLGGLIIGVFSLLTS